MGKKRAAKKRAARKRAGKKRRQLGALEPRYTFCLNPYRDQRFTRCPSCDQQTKARKYPFFIHVDPLEPVILNMTGRYCPDCDLLILHQDRVEGLLARLFAHYKPELMGNDYLVMGTVERSLWRDRMQGMGIGELTARLHDFREVVTIEPAHYGWVPADADGDAE